MRNFHDTFETCNDHLLGFFNLHDRTLKFQKQPFTDVFQNSCF